MQSIYGLCEFGGMMIKEFKTGKKAVARMDGISAGNFVLSKGTEINIVTHKFPLHEKVSILFDISDKVGGNVMMDRGTVNRLFDDLEE